MEESFPYQLKKFFKNLIVEIEEAQGELEQLYDIELKVGGVGAFPIENLDVVLLLYFGQDYVILVEGYLVLPLL